MHHTIAIVLAAGKGTRMRSSLPKVAHALAGLPMIVHVHRAVLTVADVEPLYVLGHGHDLVRGLLPNDVRVVLQTEQRGTGHAVSVAMAAIGEECDEVIVLYGDMPLLTGDTIARLRARHRESGKRATLLSATVDEPYGYGRVIRGADGEPLAVIEEKWLTSEQRTIREINTGVYVFDADWLRRVLPDLPRHGDDEIYLTDVAERAAADHTLQVVSEVPVDEIAGINDRVALAHAGKLMQRRVNDDLMRQGVTLVDPDTAYIAADATIGLDTIVEPNVIIGPSVTIGEHCLIGAGSRVLASRIGNDCRVIASQIEESEIASHVNIGPFCHVRAGSILSDGVHLGNFAETKNTKLGPGCKMGHFSYLGDATLGSNVNVGAGTITANYNGTTKQRSVIGNNVFLGVGTVLRAPIAVGDGSYTGAGSVVLHDVAAGTTVAGVPAHEIHRRGTGRDRRDDAN